MMFCTVGGSADWCSHCGKQYGDNLKKLKMDLPFDPAIRLLGIYPKELKTWISSIIFNHHDMEAAQVSINSWVDKTTMGYLYNGVLLGCKKGENFTLCHSIDAPGEHYATWNKPVRERQIPYDFTYMWNLKNKINEQTELKQTHWHRKQTDDDCQSSRVWETRWKRWMDWDVQIGSYKIVMRI